MLLQAVVRGKALTYNVLGGIRGDAHAAVTPTHNHHHHRIHGQEQEEEPEGARFASISNVSTQLFDTANGSGSGSSRDTYRDKFMGGEGDGGTAATAATGDVAAAPAQYQAPQKPPSGKKKSLRVLNSLTNR